MITRISNRKLDMISEYMIANDIPLTLNNWLELNYMRKITLPELDAEAIAQIPRHLLPEEYRDEPKAKIISIRRRNVVD